MALTSSYHELDEALAAWIGDRQLVSELAQVPNPIVDGDDPSGKPAHVDRVRCGRDGEPRDVDDDDVGTADGAIDLARQLERMVELAGRDGHPRLATARLQTVSGDGGEHLIPGDAGVSTEQTLPDESDPSGGGHARCCITGPRRHVGQKWTASPPRNERGVPGVKWMSLTPEAGSPGRREVKKNCDSRQRVFKRFSTLRNASKFRWR